MKFSICLLCIGFLAAPAMAGNDSALSEHLGAKIRLADQAFALAQQSAPPAEPQNSIVEFKQFFLSLAATATFGISKVLGLKVSPEITFIWEKTDTD